jgi:hypothetical protein
MTMAMEETCEDGCLHRRCISGAPLIRYLPRSLSSGPKMYLNSCGAPADYRQCWPLGHLSEMPELQTTIPAALSDYRDAAFDADSVNPSHSCVDCGRGCSNVCIKGFCAYCCDSVNIGECCCTPSSCHVCYACIASCACNPTRPQLQAESEAPAAAAAGESESPAAVQQQRIHNIPRKADDNGRDISPSRKKPNKSKQSAAPRPRYKTSQSKEKR